MRRIIYLSWPATEITGGIKTVFHHVETLREAGFAAFVATPDAKLPGWFETTAPILGLTDLAVQTDVLVFPENHNGLLEQFATWMCPKAVFCQNPYMAYRGVGNRRSYADFGVQSVICPTQVVGGYCRRRFPTCRVLIVPYGLDRNVFRAPTTKRLQIAFMPRKRPMEAAFIRDLFLADNPQWRGVPWVQIAGVPQAEVVRILGESAVYLSLCRFEACPLSLMEALSCGCITAGFTGFGGREMATARNGFWAGEDDCLDCVEQLTRAVRLVVEGGDRLLDVFEGAVTTATLFSRERYVASLLKCWKTLAPDAQTGP